MMLETLSADVCATESTVVYSHKDETLNITWPQTKPGVMVVEECLCSGATSVHNATRVCGGRHSKGAEWNDPDISQCPELRETTIRLCIALNSKVRLPDTDYS